MKKVINQCRKKYKLPNKKYLKPNNQFIDMYLY